MPSTTYGMILTFGDSIMIKSFTGAFLMPRSISSSTPGGGQYGSTRMTREVLDCGFYWLTIFRDTYQFVSTCKKCQKAGMAITRRHEMPQQPILFCKIFDVWDIDFMGPFPNSNGYSYILLVVDYVSRWVEAIATKTKDAKVVVDFLKFNIFYRFGVPKALISDQGSHFCNKAMSSLPLDKRPSRRKSRKHCKITNPSQKDWSRLLEDALWAYRTTYHTLLGMSPYRIVFEHRAYWEIKQCNLAYDQVEKQRKFQLQELDELHLEAYENSRLCSKWDGPFVITDVFPYGVVELKDEHTNNTFQVNGHQIKLFREGPAPTMGKIETISLMELAPSDDTS
ncbi:Pro-Pol polyprotein, partial [Mucuna pruriens]